MNFRRSHWSLTIVLVTIACSEDELLAPKQPREGGVGQCTYKLGPKTVLFDDSHDQRLSVLTDSILVQPGLVSEVGLGPGMIVVGSSPNQPFLRRTLTRAEDARGIRFTTEPAGLVDAFESLHADTSCPTPGGLVVDIPMRGSIGRDFSQGAGPLTAEGRVSVDFEGSLHFRVDVDYFRVTRVEAVADLTVSGSAQLEVAASAAAEARVELAEFPSVRLAPPTTLGVVVLTPYLSGEVELEATLQGELRASLTRRLFEVHGRGGMIYANGQYDAVRELDGQLLPGADSSAFEIVPSATGTVRLAVPVELDVLAYESGGVGVRFGPFAEAEVTARTRPSNPLACLELEQSVSAGVAAGVEAKIDVLRLFEAEWEATLWETSTQLTSRQVPFAGACCGDDTCDQDESCEVCAADCGPCQTCSPACVESEVGCVRAGVRFTCGDTNADGCLDRIEHACAAGEVCTAGRCEASTCSSNPRGCDAGQDMGPAPGCDCLPSCGAGLTWNGTTCVASCTDECSSGEVGCSSGTMRYECGQSDADACRERIAVTCEAGATCVQGACVSACGASGEPCCSGSCDSGLRCVDSVCAVSTCPAELTGVSACSFVMRFDETLGWLNAPGNLTTSPRLSELSLAPGYFSTARARVTNGSLEAEKTLAGSPPIGNFGFGVYWSTVGPARKWIRARCSGSGELECGGANPIPCDSAWHVESSSSPDTNWSCGFGRESGTTWIDWIAVE